MVVEENGINMNKEKYIEHLKELANVYRQMKKYHEEQAYFCWKKCDDMVNFYQDLEENEDGNR